MMQSTAYFQTLLTAIFPRICLGGGIINQEKGCFKINPIGLETFPCGGLDGVEFALLLDSWALSRQHLR
jgi:hypothetical protein